MTGLPVLSILIAVPLIAGIIALFLNASGARWVALIATFIDLALSVELWANYDPSGAQWQFVEKVGLGGGINWALGVDGIALTLIALTAFLMPICIGASWRSISKRVPEYMAYFLLMEALIMGSFAAQDLFLFYIFFEGGLIPMYFIIGIWGGAERIKASYKFFLYTLFGSVLMLIAMLYMAGTAHTSSIPALMAYDFPREAQTFLFLAFLASFAVKLPMWPVHTWLPDAHVQAPTAGSVILAGVLLKLGGYGFVRFSLPMFPEGTAQFVPLMFVLSGIAVVYTSLVALAQRDMKKLIAYSSVAHMAFVTFGLFALNRQGIEGAILVMLGHGLVSGALFLCVGVVYDRLHTREIAAYGGLSNNMPGYALLFMVFTMASVGLPATSNFVGEFLSLVGTYQASSWAAIVATTGIILGAAYMLYLYWRICFGVARTPEAAAMTDLSAREWWLLAPIAVGVFWMGIYPES
ncbi:MAG: NADH-quinone oxidoreductase subunit M, partial [Bradyrhizobium sp.]|nr:NADH-quinone oxidoreductase subunit M [Bradyrhizobium sp.]